MDELFVSYRDETKLTELPLECFAAGLSFMWLGAI